MKYMLISFGLIEIVSNCFNLNDRNFLYFEIMLQNLFQDIEDLDIRIFDFNIYLLVSFVLFLYIS